MQTHLRNDWQLAEISELFTLPFLDLVLQAQDVHRQHFNANTVQISTLLSIKTGACPENCAYCPQTGHYDTGVKKEKLLAVSEVVEKAKIAKESGATRFCMGAAWRGLPDNNLEHVMAMISEVKALGLETCATFGLLKEGQAEKLKEAGLDFYNHNLDTSPEYYPKIITTRTYQDRLDTLAKVYQAGIHVCCGGIVGMGETREDRLKLLQQLANLPQHPKSVPINLLIPIPGTPLAKQEPLDTFEFVRTIACARILMPKTYIRLSAGRNNLSDEAHALCFLAGINSIHYGDKLFVTPLPATQKDRKLLKSLGIKPEEAESRA